MDEHDTPRDVREALEQMRALARRMTAAVEVLGQAQADEVRAAVRRLEDLAVHIAQLAAQIAAAEVREPAQPGLEGKIEELRAMVADVKLTADRAASDVSALQTGATRAYAIAPRIEEAPASSGAPAISVLPPQVSHSISAIERTVRHQPTRSEDRLSKLALAVLIFGTAIFNYLSAHH